MVDRTILGKKMAAVRDAVARIHSILPEEPERFVADRTAREVVVLNLFVALQECVSLAAHWLADEGTAVPESYRDAFLRLAEARVIDSELASRLAAASGLRDLIAHQYGTLDPVRIHAIASTHLDDLTTFCAALASRVRETG